MTTLSYDLNGDIKPALLSWLQNDLAATNKPFIFVFVHEPPFPYSHHVGDSLDAHPTNRDAFWSLLESKKVTRCLLWSSTLLLQAPRRGRTSTQLPRSYLLLLRRPQRLEDTGPQCCRHSMARSGKSAQATPGRFPAAGQQAPTVTKLATLTKLIGGTAWNLLMST